MKLFGTQFGRIEVIQVEEYWIQVFGVTTPATIH